MAGGATTDNTHHNDVNALCSPANTPHESRGSTSHHSNQKCTMDTYLTSRSNITLNMSNSNSNDANVNQEYSTSMTSVNRECTTNTPSSMGVGAVVSQLPDTPFLSARSPLATPSPNGSAAPYLASANTATVTGVAFAAAAPAAEQVTTPNNNAGPTAVAMVSLKDSEVTPTSTAASAASTPLDANFDASASTTAATVAAASVINLGALLPKKTKHGRIGGSLYRALKDAGIDVSALKIPRGRPPRHKVGEKRPKRPTLLSVIKSGQGLPLAPGVNPNVQIVNTPVLTRKNAKRGSGKELRDVTNRQCGSRRRQQQQQQQNQQQQEYYQEEQPEQERMGVGMDLGHYPVKEEEDMEAVLGITDDDAAMGLVKLGANWPTNSSKA